MDDSGMDWLPTTPPAPFSPYAKNYMPGGWPDYSPPPLTANVFARRPPPSRFMPVAKRACTGLNIAFWASNKVAATITCKPVFAIVREVRSQQWRLRAPAVRLPNIRRRARQTPPSISQSPWARAVAFVENPAAHGLPIKHITFDTLPDQTLGSGNGKGRGPDTVKSEEIILQAPISNPTNRNRKAQVKLSAAERFTPGIKRSEGFNPDTETLTPAARRSAVGEPTSAGLRQAQMDAFRNMPRLVPSFPYLVSPFRMSSSLRQRPRYIEPTPPDSPSAQLHAELHHAERSDDEVSETSTDLETCYIPKTDAVRENKAYQPTPESSPEPVTTITTLPEEKKDIETLSRRPAAVLTPCAAQTTSDADDSSWLKDDETPKWNPTEDKAWRGMMRSLPESSDPITGKRLPIDGIISPESQKFNNILDAQDKTSQHKVLESGEVKAEPGMEKMKSEVDVMEDVLLNKTPAAKVASKLETSENGVKRMIAANFETPDAKSPIDHLANLSIKDNTPKATLHFSQRISRLTRAARRKIEAEKEAEKYKITTLSQEWDDKVKAAVRNGHGKYAATDFARVVPQYASRRGQDNWLNDEVINGYLTMIAEHGKKNDRANQVPSHHAFNSFLYKNISQKGPDSVKRWATRAKIGGKNLLETEQVYIPINQGAHWTLCVLEAKERKITVYNSLGYGGGETVARNVLDWVRNEVGSSFEEEEWRLDARGISPQQNNSDDCGVFTITSARQLMLGKFPEQSYGASDIPIQRKRIVAELVNGALLKSG